MPENIDQGPVVVGLGGAGDAGQDQDDGGLRGVVVVHPVQPNLKWSNYGPELKYLTHSATATAYVIGHLLVK